MAPSGAGHARRDRRGVRQHTDHRATGDAISVLQPMHRARGVHLGACRGVSWEAYTRAHIFEPLGMVTASFGPNGLEEAPDRALPYRHSGELVPWSRLQYLGPLAPGGGVDANINEMANYALFQLGDGTTSGHRLVSTQMMAELHRPAIIVGADWPAAARVQNLHYALGWFTGDVHGVHLVYHNGANPGFRAGILLAPSAKAGVVVLTNAESDYFIDVAARSLLQQLLR